MAQANGTSKPQAFEPLVGEVSFNSILDLKFADEEPLPFLTRNDVIFLGTSTIVTAEAKTGKSTLFNTLAYNWAVDGHKVLYLTEEYPRSWGFRTKYLDFDKIEDGEGSFTVVHPGNSPASLLARAVRGPENIVIVDSMTNLLGVSNAPGQTLEIISPWIRLMQHYGKTLILLHHTNMSGKMAGSYTLKAAVDTLVDYNIDTGLRKVSVTSRMIPEPVSFLVVKDGNTLGVQEVKGEMTLTEPQAIVYGTLDTMTPLSVDDLMLATTFPEGKVRKILKALVKKGLAQDHSSTGNVKGEPGEWVSLEEE
jgi:hypothetical protein